MVEGPEGSALEGRPHDLEVARLQVSLDVVDTDARQEAKVNAQLAQLVHMRLDAARKAVERLLGILQVGPLSILLLCLAWSGTCVKRNASHRRLQVL